jgi:hypothetical protein
LTPSDTEEDADSPSLSRKEMARKECDGQSDDEDGEEDDVEEAKTEEEAAPEPVKQHRPKIDEMNTNFINMALKFT